MKYRAARRPNLHTRWAACFLPVDESVALKIEPDKSTGTPDPFDLVAEDDPDTPEPGNPSTLDTDESLRFSIKGLSFKNENALKMLREGFSTLC